LEKLIDYVNINNKCGFITNGKNLISENILKKLSYLRVSVDDYLPQDKETKSLKLIEDNILEMKKHVNLTLMLVDYGQDYSEIVKFCKLHNISLTKQRLHPKESYQTKYRTEQKENGYKCKYITNKLLDFYFIDGSLAPCCFIVDSKINKGREYIKKSLQNKIVPKSCRGCYFLC
jgi:hypothetical protein